MAVFTYRALNDQAAAVEGTIAADTARAACDALRLRGLIVESVVARGWRRLSYYSMALRRDDGPRR